MWARLGALLAEFPAGIYLSDTRLASQARASLSARLFVKMLRRFVRGGVHMQFEDEADARRVFAERGFARFTLHRPARMPALGLAVSPGAHFVQIVDARRP
jgi:hypothetical protein